MSTSPKNKESSELGGVFRLQTFIVYFWISSAKNFVWIDTICRGIELFASKLLLTAPQNREILYYYDHS